MKVFDSGMPEENYWNSLFNTSLILDWLKLDRITLPVVEIGCGYGTFTIPLAKRIKPNRLITFDIDEKMIEVTTRNVTNNKVDNVDVILRDIIADGTGILDNSCGMVLLFNILHFDERRILLEEAARILQPNGIIAIIHWRKDIVTPRGPDIPLRPGDKIIFNAITGLNLRVSDENKILEPYHWGLQLTKGCIQ